MRTSVTLDNELGHSMDVAEVDLVQVQVSRDGVLWVHLNGFTVLRVSQIDQLVVNDQRGQPFD